MNYYLPALTVRGGYHWGLTAADGFSNSFACLQNINLVTQRTNLRSVGENSWITRQVSLQELRFKEVFYLPSSPQKALCLTQSTRESPFKHLWYFWLFPPLTLENGVDLSLFSPLSWCPLPTAVLTSMEAQTYGDIFIPSNCTWLGLSYLAKILPAQKN